MAESIAPHWRPILRFAPVNSLAEAYALTLTLWLGVSVALLSVFWHSVTVSLGGPDDALRLVEVRRLLAGQSYFDLSEPRLGLDGYFTHWSRLADLGLAGSIKFLSIFVDQDHAELLTREFWPLPFLALMMLAQTTIAYDLGGLRAARLAAPLGATCLPGFAQFAPGSIDHHHVQATLCALAVALMIRGLSSPRAAAGAAVLVALTLGVGLEAFAFVGAGAGSMALAFVADGSRGPQIRAFGLTLAAAAAAVFAATLPPPRWGTAVCDAFAINSAVLMILGGLALAAATSVARCGPSARLAATGAAGAAALLAYLSFDPACATGPFAHIDPALRALWLDHVTELRSIAELARFVPGTAVFYAAFPLLGTIAAIELLRRDRPPELVLLSAVFAVGCAVAALMMRAEVYPTWFAVPLVATALARWLDCRPNWSALRRAALVVVALPFTVGTIGFLIVNASIGRERSAQLDPAQSCFASASYQSLARLPPGLVLSQLDIASHVLALTPHRVVMAPYHRLDRDILFALRLFAGPPDGAAAQLRAARIDYIVDCAPLDLSSAVTGPMLRTALLAGKAPDFLTPLAADDGSPLLVWRVNR